jgi:hypothetical protein
LITIFLLLRKAADGKSETLTACRPPTPLTTVFGKEQRWLSRFGDMPMKRSDKFALFLCLALGAFFLFAAILGAMGGALAPSGISTIVQIWLRLCLILVMPLWLLMRACGAIFGPPKDAPFIERRSTERWR